MTNPTYRDSSLPTAAELDHALKEIVRLSAENEQLRQEVRDCFKMLDRRCVEDARTIQSKEPSLGDFIALGLAVAMIHVVYSVATWCLS